MMSTKSIADELQIRISAELTFHNGRVPERTAIAWRGYLAAMLEWQLLTLADYDQLVQQLPDVRDDPVVDIMLGREETQSSN